MKFFFLLFLPFFGCVNGVKAISSRPFNHEMTGSGPVLVCVCVNCGPIDQNQRWGDGIEGQGWLWTQQLPGSLPSFPAPLGPAQGHLSKFYLIPEVLDLSVIAYERGDWPPLWAFFWIRHSWYWTDIVCHYRWQKHCKNSLINTKCTAVIWLQVGGMEEVGAGGILSCVPGD